MTLDKMPRSVLPVVMKIIERSSAHSDAENTHVDSPLAEAWRSLPFNTKRDELGKRGYDMTSARRISDSRLSTLLAKEYADAIEIINAAQCHTAALSDMNLGNTLFRVRVAIGHLEQGNVGLAKSELQAILKVYGK